MSERTTIGGTTYETVGSSTSNLLLRSNGTVRVQWGNKLIDLIKNGKIASSDSSLHISVITDVSEIKSDGIYVLDNQINPQLWIYKSGKQFNLTGTELYISASTKQDITVDQQKQALENIGMYYNTLEEVEESGVQNGLVYVLENSTLYTVKEGVISEFEAKLKTVTVEKEDIEGEVINSSVKIVLSIADLEYITLENNAINISRDLVIQPNAQLCSENASESRGYRMYISGDTSYLEVDELIVRNGLDSDTSECIKITFEEIQAKVSENSLQLGMWYVVTDFQNHWKLVKPSSSNDRPILIQALSSNTFCDYGMLYNNRDVKIKYDFNFRDSINGEAQNARGKITWMKDSYGNEANFDFLDYSDAQGNPLTTLYDYGDSIHKSIFPPNSHDNKITINNLKGTVLVEGVINDENTSMFDIQSENCRLFNNTLFGEGLTISSGCGELSNTTISLFHNIVIKSSIVNTSFDNISNCVFNSSFSNCNFKTLTDCTFSTGSIVNCSCYSDINNYNFSTTDSSLYDESSYKRVYFNNNQLQVFIDFENYFKRGMIIMHSGFENPPAGWAVCDGRKVTVNGEEITLPNLVGRFIKAVSSTSDIGAVNNYNEGLNNDFTLTVNHLPQHSHPHDSHTHTLSGLSATATESGDLTLSSSTEYMTGTEVTTIKVNEDGAPEGDTADTRMDVVSGISDVKSSVSVSGGNHTHDITISGGTIEATPSKEAQQTWENKAFKIEPNYYSLIFIMKL